MIRPLKKLTTGAFALGVASLILTGCGAGDPNAASGASGSVDGQITVGVSVYDMSRL